MLQDFWTSPDLEKKLEKARAARRRTPLSPDERATAALVVEEDFKAFMRLASDRAAKIKHRLYNAPGASDREVGMLIGELRALEWLAFLPSNLSERQRRNHEEEVA